MLKKIILSFALITILSSSINAKTTQEELDSLIASTTKEQLLQIKDNDHIIGNINAPVTIFEYASLSCAHCADFHTNTLPKIKENYIDTGKANLIFRHFPLNEPALIASLLSDCSNKNEAKTKFLNVLFNTQNNWASKKNFPEIIENIGKLGGITGEEFQQCINNEKMKDDILIQRFLAMKILDIRSTPSFYVNNIFVSGAKSYKEFSNIIEEEFSKIENNL